MRGKEEQERKKEKERRKKKREKRRKGERGRRGRGEGKKNAKEKRALCFPKIYYLTNCPRYTYIHHRVI